MVSGVINGRQSSVGKGELLYVSSLDDEESNFVTNIKTESVRFHLWPHDCLCWSCFSLLASLCLNPHKEFINRLVTLAVLEAVKGEKGKTYAGCRVAVRTGVLGSPWLRQMAESACQRHGVSVLSHSDLLILSAVKTVASDRVACVDVCLHPSIYQCILRVQMQSHFSVLVTQPVSFLLPNTHISSVAWCHIICPVSFRNQTMNFLVATVDGSRSGPSGAHLNGV